MNSQKQEQEEKLWAVAEAQAEFAEIATAIEIQVLRLYQIKASLALRHDYDGHKARTLMSWLADTAILNDAFCAFDEIPRLLRSDAKLTQAEVFESTDDGLVAA
jgi:hypothetical protein